MPGIMNFDQHIAEWINHNRFRSLDQFFILFTDSASFVAYSIPVLFLIYAFIKKNRLLRINGLQMLCSILLNTLLVTVIKNIVKRQRPYEMDNLIDKLTGGGGFSFPSGHTADAFVIASAVTLLLKRNRWLLIPLWTWALIVGYSRIMLGVHYLSDVVASMLIGSSCAIFIHLLFRNTRHQEAENNQYGSKMA
jgi:undecaprenyl-diphosphatase